MHIIIFQILRQRGRWIKHAKYIYNIQDFNPEQVLAVGYTKSKFVTDAMMWFDKFSCKRADLIYSLNAGDIHWCVNAKGIKGVSCPSNVYSTKSVAA